MCLSQQQAAPESPLPKAMELDAPAGVAEGPAPLSPRPPSQRSTSENGKVKRHRSSTSSGSQSTLSPTSSMADGSQPGSRDCEDDRAETERVMKRATTLWNPETSCSSRDTAAHARQAFGARAFSARALTVSAPYAPGGGGSGGGGSGGPPPTATASPSSAMQQLLKHTLADCEMLPPRSQQQQQQQWQQQPEQQQQQQQQQRQHAPASSSADDDRMRCQAELATTRMIGGSGAVISQDAFLDAIQGGRDAAEVFEFRWPRERQASRASTILNLNQRQHGVMYALAGCSDVMYVMSRVKAPVREALQKLYDIDKVNFYTWFKNRRLPLKRLLVRHVAKNANLAALKAAGAASPSPSPSDEQHEHFPSEPPSSRPPLQSRHSMPLLRASGPLPALPSELLRPRLSLQGQQAQQQQQPGGAGGLGSCLSQLLLQHTSQPLLHPQGSSLQYLSLPMQQHLSMPAAASDSRDSRHMVMMQSQQQQHGHGHGHGSGGYGDPMLCMVPRVSGDGSGQLSGLHQQQGQQFSLGNSEGQYQLVTSVPGAMPFTQCQAQQGARWAGGPKPAAAAGGLRGGICLQQLVQQHAAAQQQQQQREQREQQQREQHPRLMLQSEHGGQPIMYVPQLVYVPKGYTVMTVPSDTAGAGSGSPTARRSA